MIISALAKYYDCLVDMEDSPLVAEGFAKVKINYVAVINQDGELKDLMPHFRTRLVGKKEIEEPIEEVFPERVATAKPNLIEHRSKYIFGLSTNESGEFICDGSLQKYFKKCKMQNIDLLDSLKSPLAIAMKKFYEKWIPAEQLDNPILKGILKKFDSSYFTFCLDSDPCSLINKDVEILEKVKELKAEKEKSEKNEKFAQCSICGEYLKIARLHDKLKGIMGANGSGSNIVCCNNPSDWSYGKKQSYVSSVSEKVMKKYTQAFNVLTESRRNKSTIGDMTLLFWAETSQKPLDYADIFSIVGFMCTDKKTEITQNVKTCLEMLARGKLPDIKEIGLDADTKFYLLGLTPNSSRDAIKLFYENNFGKILENVQDHIENILVKEDQKVPSVYSIASELVAPTKKKKDSNASDCCELVVLEKKKNCLNASLISGLLNSVITRSMYPQNLLAQVLLRIKTDQDEKDNKNNFIKINDTRVGIIKAYLNRKNKINNKGEMITMALNEKNLEKPYLCGRLFAVLEKLQKDANSKDEITDENSVIQSNSGGKSTIKAKYFSSACVTPALIFPSLLKFAQNHIDKLENSGYLESKISDIINLLGDSFPRTLSIEEQGKFVIGYYQQNKDLYTKKGE